MKPPKEQIFNSRDHLIASVRQHALSHGYVICIKRSNANRNILLGCDRGGIKRNRISDAPGVNRRKTPSRRIGCPFMLYGKRIEGDKWELRVRNPEHNHETDNLIEHPAARTLKREQLQIVFDMLEIGLKPRDILAFLKKRYPGTLIIPRDIYNARGALRTKKLERQASENEEAMESRVVGDSIQAEGLESIQRGSDLRNLEAQASDADLPLLLRNSEVEFGRMQSGLDAETVKGQPYSTIHTDSNPTSGVESANTNRDVEALGVRKKAPSKCSGCGTVGHTWSSCKKRDSLH